MAQYFKIQSFPLDGAASWAAPVALVVPIECNRIVIENKDGVNALSIRTDANDGGSEKVIPAGMELEIWSNAQTATFQKGDILGYFLPAGGGVGPAVVSFTR